MLSARRSAVLRAAGLLGLSALSALPLAAFASAPQPYGLVGGWLAEVEIIDRDTGRALPVYMWRGERYVAGEPGRRYAIALRNRTVGRVLAVMSVDGVNVVTGETASWDQNGYVFAGEQRWEVRGWRKSQERIAAFEFTRLADSYAARTGRPDHVGVIGVALFRERPPRVPPAPSLSQRKDESSDAGGAANRAQAPAAAADSQAPGQEARREAPRDLPRERLGTGHGASEWSQVGTTQFERWQGTPDEVITIRYDSRQNLIAMGVIPAPQPLAQQQPNPFPAALGFVPDPPPR